MPRGRRLQRSGPAARPSGRENPGRENPGRENPGRENPGRENPGRENPGRENPLARHLPVEVVMNARRIAWRAGSILTVIAAVCASASMPTSASAPAAATAAATWGVLGPRNIPSFTPGVPAGAGKLQAFAVDLRKPSLMYAGGGIGPGDSGPSSGAGIFKSTDAGHAWVPADAGVGDPMVDALWMDQAKPWILLAGTWTRGIYRTTNGGARWRLVRDARWSTRAFVSLGPALYAATSRGIAESTNAGATWRIVRSTPSPVGALAASGHALYAGLDDGDVLLRRSPGSPWVSVFRDGGRNVWSIAADPADPANALVVEFFNYETPDLYRTTDGGASWSSVSLPGNAPAQVIAYDQTDPSIVYAGFDGGIAVSNDGGATWGAGPIGSFDTRFLYSWPSRSGTLVVGSDQGLYLTSDGGATWTGLNQGISSSLLTGLAVSGSSIMTAVQDYSPIMSTDGGATWAQEPVGEDGGVAFAPGNPQMVYEWTTAGFTSSSNGANRSPSRARRPRASSRSLARAT